MVPPSDNTISLSDNQASQSLWEKCKTYLGYTVKHLPANYNILAALVVLSTYAYGEKEEKADECIVDVLTHAFSGMVLENIVEGRLFKGMAVGVNLARFGDIFYRMIKDNSAFPGVFNFIDLANHLLNINWILESWNSKQD